MHSKLTDNKACKILFSSLITKYEVISISFVLVNYIIVYVI